MNTEMGINKLSIQPRKSQYLSTSISMPPLHQHSLQIRSRPEPATVVEVLITQQMCVRSIRVRPATTVVALGYFSKVFVDSSRSRHKTTPHSGLEFITCTKTQILMMNLFLQSYSNHSHAHIQFPINVSSSLHKFLTDSSSSVNSVNNSLNNSENHTRQKIIHNSVKAYDILVK